MLLHDFPLHWRFGFEYNTITVLGGRGSIFGHGFKKSGGFFIFWVIYIKHTTFLGREGYLLRKTPIVFFSECEGMSAKSLPIKQRHKRVRRGENPSQMTGEGPPTMHTTATAGQRGQGRIVSSPVQIRTSPDVAAPPFLSR